MFLLRMVCYFLLSDPSFFSKRCRELDELILLLTLCPEISGEPQTKMVIVTSGKLEKLKGARTTILKRGDISGALHFFARDPSSGTIKVCFKLIYFRLRAQFSPTFSPAVCCWMFLPSCDSNDSGSVKY